MILNNIFKSCKKLKYLLSKNLLKKLLRGNSKYIIRLDDACETMDLKKWEKIESILDELKIKPIVAVIPSNKDETLYLDQKNGNFWELIFSWQKKGWEIALHGYEHKYHKIKRNDQFLPLHERSEFASLEPKLQESKILKGLSIFKKNNIDTQIWVAPSHSFDKNTVRIIKDQTKIKFISDGIALYPFIQDGVTFIPQQIWKPFKFPLGIWTICLHPNNMNDFDINELKKIICQEFYNNKFINLNSIEKYVSNYNILSLLLNRIFHFKLFLKHRLKRINN